MIWIQVLLILALLTLMVMLGFGLGFVAGLFLMALYLCSAAKEFGLGFKDGRFVQQDGLAEELFGGRDEAESSGIPEQSY